MNKRRIILFIILTIFLINIDVLADDSESSESTETKKVSCCCKNSDNKYETVEYENSCPDSCGAGSCKKCARYNSEHKCYTTIKPSCASDEPENSCSSSTKELTITGVTGESMISYGSSQTVKVANCGDNCTLTIDNGNYASISGGKGEFTLTAKNYDNSCKHTVKVTASRDTVYSGGYKTEYTSQSVSNILLYAPWGETPEKATYKFFANNSDSLPYVSKQDAQAKGISYYTGDCKFTGSKVSIGALSLTLPEVECTVYKRGCSGGCPTGMCCTAPKCYKDKTYGMYYWGSCLNSQYFEEVAGVDEKNCITKFGCSTNFDDGNPGNPECNGQSEIKSSYKKTCGDNGKIYKITCDEKIRTDFDGPVFDNTMESNNNSFLYPGTGFMFKYQASSKVECSGSFDTKYYNAAIDYIDNYVKTYLNKYSDHDQIVGTGDKEIDEKFFNAPKDSLKEIASQYINWDFNYRAYLPTGVIYDVASTVSNAISLEFNWTSEEQSVCGKLPKDDGGKLDSNGKISFTSGVTNNIHSFDRTIVNGIEAQMPIAYLNDKENVTYTECSGCENLGRQFFISKDIKYIDSDNYSYTVQISDLGLSGEQTDTNTCYLKILNNTLGDTVVYRSVNLSDPFILELKPDRKIGYNWKDSKYDFTRILDTKIWSKESDYNKVTIDINMGKKIKDETKNGVPYYEGYCSKGNGNKNSTICQLYRSAKKD